VACFCGFCYSLSDGARVSPRCAAFPRRAGVPVEFPGLATYEEQR